MAGVANIGLRPTATANGRACLEVHLSTGRRTATAAHICAHFLHRRLRAEQNSPRSDALRADRLDSQTARDWLAANLPA